jgi:UDP-N-acetyl-D-glucosamine dehydrogenase
MRALTEATPGSQSLSASQLPRYNAVRSEAERHGDRHFYTRRLQVMKTAGQSVADDGQKPWTADQAVAVIGLGYVGLPTATALAHAGMRVLGLDSSPARLEAIDKGSIDLPASERGRVSDAIEHGNLLLSADPARLREADAVLVCVPTPIDQDAQPDLRPLARACRAVTEFARTGQTFILTSTAHVGSSRQLLVEPLTLRGFEVGEDVSVCFSPERIDPGVPEHRQTSTPRVIGGYSPRCAKRAASVLSPTCSSLAYVSSLEAAEMTKLYENTFRAVNIALSFEIADACEHYGLDPVEVTDAAASKPYAFMAHYPSAGVGGHCIGVDPYYLLRPLREQGAPAPMAEQALELICRRPGRVTARALDLLGDPAEQRVLVVGASYKPGVADMRQSPGVAVISELHRAGVHVSYFDPLIPALEADGRYYEHTRQPDSSDYDLTVLITVHPGVDYAFLARCGRVLDCTYRTPGGVERYTIGSGARPVALADGADALASTRESRGETP